MPRSIAEIAADMKAAGEGDALTSALIPATVKRQIALASEMVEAAAALEARVDDLAETFAAYIEAHPATDTAAG